MSSFDLLPIELYYEIFKYVDFTIGRSINSKFKEISDKIKINNGHIVESITNIFLNLCSSNKIDFRYIFSITKNYDGKNMATIFENFAHIYGLVIRYEMTSLSNESSPEETFFLPNPDTINYFLRNHPLYHNKQFVHNSFANSMKFHLSIINELFSERVSEVYKSYYLHNKMGFN